MARYYRRRYRTIVRAPKKKWASNIQNVALATTGSATLQFSSQVLVSNSTELSSPTPVIVKTGNIRVQGDYRASVTQDGSAMSVSLYVVFVPQGISLATAIEANSLIINHPEWVMAWKFLGANRNPGTNIENYDGFSFSSRLKRNLNSGDTVRLLCIVEGSNIDSVLVNGMAQYWTCAN